MPIDFYAVCETHKVTGPGVWRCPDPAALRWFLIEHLGCVVRVYDEHHDQATGYTQRHFVPTGRGGAGSVDMGATR